MKSAIVIDQVGEHCITHAKAQTELLPTAKMVNEKTIEKKALFIVLWQKVVATQLKIMSLLYDRRYD